MKKYFGIVKVITESMVGIDTKILTKYSDDISYIEQWFELYPQSEKMVLENNQKLQDFFKDFEDYSLVTEKEKKEAHITYEKFMKKN